MNDSIENNGTGLRARLKQLRAQQDPTHVRRGALLMRGRLYTWLATASEALAQLGRPAPQRIAAYWPLSSEPDLRPLLEQWVEEEGLQVLLPAVTGPGLPLEFRSWTPATPMRTGAFGIAEPEGPAAPPPDVVLVPTLGFTRQGDRVGYGQGYYDRTLAALSAQGHAYVSIGIAWACGDLSGQNYQPAPHDVPLHGILTDKGWAVPAPDLTKR